MNFLDDSVKLIFQIEFQILVKSVNHALSHRGGYFTLLVKKKEKYNANSVIPHNVLASDYLTDCHQALFFQQDTLVY